MKKLLKSLILATGFVATSSQAAIVTLVGNDVQFTFDDSTLFGSASVVGNSISFQPTTFTASSNNTDGSVLVSDTINVTIESLNPAFDMTSFFLYETGSYNLVGNSTSVSVSGQLQITSFTTTCPVITCNEASTFDTGSITNSTSNSWSDSATVDLGDNLNGWVSDTKVNLQISNELLATSTMLGDSASITKSFSGVGITVNPIPVPAALWLFGSGLLALAAMFRRKAA